MIVILKVGYDEEQLQNLITWFEGLGVGVHLSSGEQTTILGLVGDTSALDINLIKAIDIVDDVTRVQEPFKKANRKYHPNDTIIDIRGRKLGADFQIIAGPCSVESEQQICAIADSVLESGATMLRGGAFKPRTSPYDFQGLKAEGLDLLFAARDKTGLPVVSEIMNANHIELFEDVDIIQVGARNMQNFELLRELGRTNKPILLKRGLANTIEELLMSAEYIMAGGNENIILCERGIRTFEKYTRNTLDLSAIPLLKELTHLPIVVDPSHATGISRLVKPMSLAAAVCGADGIIIEVHNDPKNALCDGAQSLTPEAFADLVVAVNAVRAAVADT